MIVISGDIKLEVGKIYQESIASPEQEWHLMGFKVIGEATLDDFLRVKKELGVLDTGVYGKYFYFVQMD